MFGNHRAFPPSLGAGRGRAAVGGGRGCEGLRWLFVHEGFAPGFALAGAWGLGDVTERVPRWPWLGLRCMSPATLERSLVQQLSAAVAQKQHRESPGSLGIAAD